MEKRSESVFLSYARRGREIESSEEEHLTIWVIREINNKKKHKQQREKGYLEIESADTLHIKTDKIYFINTENEEKQREKKEERIILHSPSLYVIKNNTRRQRKTESKTKSERDPYEKIPKKLTWVLFPSKIVLSSR